MRRNQIQAWLNDSRVAAGPPRQSVVTATNSVSVEHNFQNAEGGVGQYVIGTFTADTASCAGWAGPRPRAGPGRKCADPLAHRNPWLPSGAMSRSLRPMDDLTIRCGLELTYEAIEPTPMVLLVQPRLEKGQRIEREQLSFSPNVFVETYADVHDNIVRRCEKRRNSGTLYTCARWPFPAPTRAMCANARSLRPSRTRMVSGPTTCLTAVTSR